MSERIVPDNELKQVKTLLESLERDMDYFAKAINVERRELESRTSATTADVLKARGFSLAHAGRNEQAMADLKALVSQADHATARNLNKLAQVLVRIGQRDTFEEAITISDSVLSRTDLADGEKWFAHHNRAAALIGLGSLQDAIAAADAALAVQHDERTRLLKVIAEHGPNLVETLADAGIAPAQMAEVSPETSVPKVALMSIVFSETR